MLQSYVLLGTLGIHSIEDIKNKKINIVITGVSAIVSVLLHLFLQNESIFEMLAGVLPGAGIIGISYLTKGKIGKGDGIVYMLTGLYLGVVKNLCLIGLSLFLAGVWGMILLYLKKCEKRQKLPLMPFLFIAYVMMMFGGVGT